MYDIVEDMNLDDHPKSIFTTDDSQTKVRACCKATEQKMDIYGYIYKILCACMQPDAPSMYELLFQIISCLIVACERRRISGCRLSPPKTNVCEHDFRDVKILSQSQLGLENPRTATRVACKSIAQSRGK